MFKDLRELPMGSVLFSCIEKWGHQSLCCMPQIARHKQRGTCAPGHLLLASICLMPTICIS